MCGRFVLSTPTETLARQFGFRMPLVSPEPEWTGRARYNVAPTQPVLVAGLNPEGELEGAWARWGIPAAGGRLAINARVETLRARPAFLGADRALLFADGFFEWRPSPGGRQPSARQPLYFQRADGAPLVFAAVVSGQSGVVSAAIVTVPAGEDVRSVHDRMPAVLDGDRTALWLDPATLPRDVLGPAPAGTLRSREVSPRVNRVDHDDPSCLDSPPPKAQLSLFDSE